MGLTGLFSESAKAPNKHSEALPLVMGVVGGIFFSWAGVFAGAFLGYQIRKLYCHCCGIHPDGGHGHKPNAKPAAAKKSRKLTMAPA